MGIPPSQGKFHPKLPRKMRPQNMFGDFLSKNDQKSLKIWPGWHVQNLGDAFFLEKTAGGSAALVQVPAAVFSGPKIGQGRKLVRKVKIWKVLRMGLPIVENLSGLQESIFSLSRRPQVHFGQKSKIDNLAVNSRQELN